jgi:tetratricopeptide (TPR) repeat protein/O-antigen ligase
MNKKNIIKEKLPIVYKIGISLILLLVLLNVPPIFSPPAFGKSIPFRIIFSLLVLIFTYDFFFKKNSSIFRNVIEKIKGKKEISFFAPLILLFFLTISIFFSIDRNFSLFGDPSRGGGFLNFLFIFLFSYLLFFLLNKDGWKGIWKTLFFTGVVATFFAILQWKSLFGDVIIAKTSRPYASFGNPTILGVYLSLLIFPLFLFFLQEKNRLRKSIYLVSLSLIIFGMLLTYTRAALLGVIFGAIYFGLFFPAKERIFRTLKLGFLLLVTLGVFSVWFVTTFGSPSFVKSNDFLYGLTQRMDVRTALADPRIGGFVIGWDAILEKPLTGYGVENFAYAFDRHYHPDAPFIWKDIPWWDKAHNLPIEMGTWGGFPALFALLFLFVTLFLSLRKNPSLESHTMKATLIAFFVANLFTVDDFSTYLLLAVIIGYIFSLTVKREEVDIRKELEKRDSFSRYKYPVFLSLTVLTLFFINNYNYQLLSANRDIVMAEAYQGAGNCEKALLFANKGTEKDNPIISHLLFKKALIVEKCFEGEEKAKRLMALTSAVTKKRPSYTRAWTNFGVSAMGYVPFAEEKEETIEIAKKAFEKAIEISPNRFPVYDQLGQVLLAQGKWEEALDTAEECLELTDYAPCHFIKGVALSALGQSREESFQKIGDRWGVVRGLNGVINTHIHTKNYEAMIPLYLILIEEDSENPQYFSSVATAYREIGDYKKAREYALKALEAQPEASYIVNLFLDSLPQ